MTPSGKIDRKALPEPEWQGSDHTVSSPRNDFDLKIQKVWQEILGIESIGIDEHFFSWVVISIKAIQVVSRLALDFEVGINDIFQYPTIRALADNIKYSKDRLKQFVYTLREAAASGENGVPGVVWKMRESLKEYRKKNQGYENIDLSERADYRNVLLVGGTGYLGIHILFQLLQNTEYKVYVPVRGTNDEEALERLWAKLKFHFGLELDGQNVWKDRVCVFCGDLTEDLLWTEPGAL